MSVGQAVPVRTLAESGTELQTRVAENGVRILVLCECGAILADAVREGADPEAQVADNGFGLAESLGWLTRRFECSDCGVTWAPREVL